MSFFLTTLWVPQVIRPQAKRLQHLTEPAAETSPCGEMSPSAIPPAPCPWPAC